MIGKIFLILFAAAALFVGGYIYSYSKSNDAAVEEYYFITSKVPDTEKLFLKTLDASQLLPPRLESGVYVLEIRMPTGNTTRKTINIPFVNNNFAFPPSESGRLGMEDWARIEGRVVSWRVEGRGYDPGIEFVGVVSGSQMFGHVYNYEQTPEGHVGFWRLFPEEEDMAKESKGK